MTKLEATIADLRIAVSLTTEPGEDLLVPRERVTELLDEIDRLRAIEQRTRAVIDSTEWDPAWRRAARHILGEA